MNSNDAMFPNCTRLWRGAVLNTIAHAIWSAPDSDPITLLDWRGDVYLRTDWSGTSGALAFDGAHHERVVGAFQDVHSSRTPAYRQDHGLPDYDLQAFLSEVPVDLHPLLDQVLSFNLYNLRGVPGPIVTSVFWSDDERLTAADSWSAVVAHGGHVLGAEVIPDDDSAMQWLRKDLQLSPAQCTLVFALFSRRMASEGEPVVVKPWERAQLTSRGKAGIMRTRELLDAVGIVLP